MIHKVVEIPVTAESRPFASAERYLSLSRKGYAEREYYLYGSANVYKTNADGSIGVRTADAPYVDRCVVRQPIEVGRFSGHVVIEILNATALIDIDRMWVLGYRQFLRDGDIYIGITSKHATLPQLKAYDEERYGALSWPNPTPDAPFEFSQDELRRAGSPLRDFDPLSEPGLFWDMLSDFAGLLRSDDPMNPIRMYANRKLVLTGWSQSACYMIRYINDFLYRDQDGPDLFDGFLLGAPPRRFITPVSQYECSGRAGGRPTIGMVRKPTIVFQTESENAPLGGAGVVRRNGTSPDFLVRQYDVAGASHDTMDTFVRYYRRDPDLMRIGALPAYVGKHALPNNYPSYYLFGAGFRNLFRWIDTGTAPAECGLIPIDNQGNNRKDAFGNSLGGLRTCLINYPTRTYHFWSDIPSGGNATFPDTDIDVLFGHEDPFPKEMLVRMYGNLAAYRKKAEEDTFEQVARGFVAEQDAQGLIDLAVGLAADGGLKE